MFSVIILLKIILKINLAEWEKHLALHSRRKKGIERLEVVEVRSILKKSKNKFGG